MMVNDVASRILFSLLDCFCDLQGTSTGQAAAGAATVAAGMYVKRKMAKGNQGSMLLSMLRHFVIYSAHRRAYGGCKIWWVQNMAGAK